MPGQPLRQPPAGADQAVARIGTGHVSLREAALDELRRRIVDGVYPQGSRLLEEELAAELEVSRNPVREALQALAGEGFVTIEPRRGARVSEMSTQRARDLFEVRQALEGTVAALAARRRTDQQLARLHDVVGRGLAAGAAGDLAALPALNTRFHELLADAAGNELLAEMLDRLAHVIRWIYTARITLRSVNSWHEHSRIADAIAAGDDTLAEHEARAHIANAATAFFADLEPDRDADPDPAPAATLGRSER